MEALSGLYVPLPRLCRLRFPLAPRWLHGLAYAGLAVEYALEDRPWRDRTVLAVVFVIAVGYRGGIELLQSTLDARTADFGDILVNAVGAAVAVVCWRVATRWVRCYRA